MLFRALYLVPPLPTAYTRAARWITVVPMACQGAAVSIEPWAIQNRLEENGWDRDVPQVFLCKGITRLNTGLFELAFPILTPDNGALHGIYSAKMHRLPFPAHA